MSEQIDWSKAPEWAVRVVRIGMAQNIAWACDSKYQYLSGDGPFLFFDDPADGFMLCQATLVDARPTTPSWSGEGLPPVGVECEALYMGQPQGVVTVRYSGQCMILWSEDRSSEQCGQAEHYLFRPIRTPEQIAADEREKAIDQMVADTQAAHGWAEAFGMLHDKGYRKP